MGISALGLGISLGANGGCQIDPAIHEIFHALAVPHEHEVKTLRRNRH